MSSSDQHGLPLEEYRKDVPPGWHPDKKDYPLRRYFELLRLWIRLTNLEDTQVGPAIAGRLKGRAQTIALSLRFDVIDGNGNQVTLHGDDALAHPGSAGQGVGRAVDLSGPKRLLEKLEATFGPQDTTVSAMAIKRSEDCGRGTNQSLVEFLSDWQHLYEQAAFLGGYQLNNVARTNRLLL